MFKADLSGGTFDANITKVNGVDVNSVDDFKDSTVNIDYQSVRDAMGLRHTNGTPSVDAQLTEANNNHQNLCS